MKTALFLLICAVAAIERGGVLVAWWRRKLDQWAIEGRGSRRLPDTWRPRTTATYETRMLADFRQEGSRR